MKIRLFSLLLISAIMINTYAQEEEEEENYIKSDITSTLENGEKVAILMVHFGTTYDKTRAETIDAINKKAKETFPHLEVREAYTSRIIVRRLKERNIEKLHPVDALLKLRADGYSHIVVQSTNIIDGVEIESLRNDIAKVSALFKEVRIGTSLLHSVKDAESVIKIMAAKRKKGSHMVLVGHGTYTPSTATYAMIDYMCRDLGYDDIHVGTIEGYPSYDNLLSQLKTNKAKSVLLLPFMFVAGEHANNDIAVEWKDKLEKEGYQVEVRIEGLGQDTKIQDIFIDHLRFSMAHKTVSIMDKKKAYQQGADRK